MTKLVVEIDAKVGNLNQELGKIDKSLNELDKNTKGADISLASFAGTAKNAALAVAGAATAFTAFVTITAKSRKELQLLADQAGETTGDFEALAFATETYGVTAEQIADISKDVSDKIGEFATAGTGAFQDVADVLGLTSEEAVKFAQSLQGLTSTEVIQEISNQLESVNATAEQSTFVFESLGNDLSKLTPLFADNGKELATLADRYNEANAALSLTAQQENDLAALADTSRLLTEQLGNSATLIAATVAPAFNSFFNAVIEIVPEATNTIVDFFNKFQEAAAINSIDSINREIETLTQRSADYEEQLQSLLSGEYQLAFGNEQEINAQAEALSEVNQRLEDLKNRREELIAQQATIDEVTARTGGDFSVTGTSTVDLTKAEEEAANQLAIIEDRLKSEEQLLAEKLEREQEIVGNNFDLQVELYEEYLNNLEALDQKRLSQVESSAKKEAQAAAKSDKDKLDSQLAYANAAINIGNLLFEDNKALRAGLVVADTAAGIVRAFADLPYPAALAASASIAATGLAQLSAINSASKGGGSVASSSSAAPVDTTLPEETPELSIGAGDVSGANQSIIIRIEGGGDDITEAIAKNIKVMQVNGTLEA